MYYANGYSAPFSHTKRGTRRSIIDWPFNYKLHGKMVANPSWREKNASGGDISLHGQFMYGLEVPDMKSAWVETCVAAVKAGCKG